jgi:hypothetical protein
MAKVLCDFTFDDEIYILIASLGRGLSVDAIAACDNAGRKRAADVHEQCALLSVLLHSGIPFETFERAQKLGPLTMSIVASVTRARHQVAASMACSKQQREKQLIAGNSL